MNRIFSGSVFLAMLTAGVAAWAQSPMTPSRLNAPTPGSISWVEPPPGSKTPAASGSTAVALPAAKPESQAVRETDKQRPSRRAAQHSRSSGDSVADRLNRQELNRVHSGGYRGYSPWAGY
jgi:hypothetical protein